MMCNDGPANTVSRRAAWRERSRRVVPDCPVIEGKRNFACSSARLVIGNCSGEARSAASSGRVRNA